MFFLGPADTNARKPGSSRRAAAGACKGSGCIGPTEKIEYKEANGLHRFKRNGKSCRLLGAGYNLLVVRSNPSHSTLLFYFFAPTDRWDPPTLGICWARYGIGKR
jgi:hypothetical protein